MVSGEEKAGSGANPSHGAISSMTTDKVLSVRGSQVLHL